MPAGRIEVIAPAVDTHPALDTSLDAGAGRPRASPSCCTSGSIFTRRHVPDLIEAFGRLARTDPSLRLTLVGADRTWPPQDVAARIRSSPGRDRIDWQPWVSDGALRDLYARASAFVFLSEYEGFGLTPLEALRAGVPPVVADVPVAHEAYGEAALFVDPGEPSAIAGALGQALHDEVTRRRILGAAGAVLGRYSWDDSARRTWRVLLERSGNGAVVTGHRLDIVIVSFNARDDLRQCLGSLRARSTGPAAHGDRRGQRIERWQRGRRGRRLPWCPADRPARRTPGSPARTTWASGRGPGTWSCSSTATRSCPPARSIDWSPPLSPARAPRRPGPGSSTARAGPSCRSAG